MAEGMVVNNLKAAGGVFTVGREYFYVIFKRRIFPGSLHIKVSGAEF